MAPVLNCTFCPTSVPPRIVAVLAANVNCAYYNMPSAANIIPPTHSEEPKYVVLFLSKN